MKFKIEKVANMVYITSECGVIFKSWHEQDFTERKLKNATNRITKALDGLAEFTRTF